MPGAFVTEIGFHDIDRHSGEPQSPADWSSLIANGFLGWRTQSFAQNPFANAVHWGTVYNFRFQADRAPVTGDLGLLLFRPGSPGALTVQASVPGP